MHGYGQIRFKDLDEEPQEGLFEKDHFKESKCKIESYNPNVHIIATKHDYKKYLVTGDKDID